MTIRTDTVALDATRRPVASGIFGFSVHGNGVAGPYLARVLYEHGVVRNLVVQEGLWYSLARRLESLEVSTLADAGDVYLTTADHADDLVTTAPAAASSSESRREDLIFDGPLGFHTATTAPDLLEPPWHSAIGNKLYHRIMLPSWVRSFAAHVITGTHSAASGVTADGWVLNKDGKLDGLVTNAHVFTATVVAVANQQQAVVVWNARDTDTGGGAAAVFNAKKAGPAPFGFLLAYKHSTGNTITVPDKWLFRCSSDG